MKINYQNLEKKIDFKFRNKDLLIQSLTHKSFNINENNEKIEFLGDRVLGLVIAKKLLEIYPKEKEGALDKKFASLVNKNTCYEVGKRIKLNTFILIGNSSKRLAKIENKIISDSCESIIGAIYLDRGYECVKKFILNFWKEYFTISTKLIVDSKTKLQEFSLKKFKTLPIYKVISNTGPRHKPDFKVGVKINNTKFFYSKGKSKKSAEQSAAKELLKSLKIV